jgi:hypothetical protein
MYRVLCFALLCGTPAAASLVQGPDRVVTSSRPAADAPLEVLLYGFRATGEAAPHPLSDAGAHWMWDALGGGCVDAGGWDDPFPDGKGDLRSAAFCIPQPCMRTLTPGELSRDVLGRELEAGEYAVYLDRLGETCGTLPVSPTDLEADLGVEDLLELASLAWVDLLEAADPLVPDDDGADAGALPALYAAGAQIPTMASATPGPRFGASRRDTRRTPIFFEGPLGSGGSSRRQAPRVPRAIFAPLAATSQFAPPVIPAGYGPGERGTAPARPVEGWGGDRPGEKPSPRNPGSPTVTTPQPAPVPIPGTLALLGGALVALRFHGARRSRDGAAKA